MNRLLFLALSLFIAVAPLEGQRRRPSSPPADTAPVNLRFDFQEGLHGWTTGFADYSPENGDMELESGIRPLPPELGGADSLYINGHNRSDDLFMFLKRRLGPEEGVRPNQAYEISFRIAFASNAGDGAFCTGVGGAPGAGVYLKAGVVAGEPQAVLESPEQGGNYRMNVDKGNQSVGGPAASIAGTIENGTANCFDGAPFVGLEKTHLHPYVVRANGAGELWLLIGTDSAFEGRTTLYYRSVSVTLTPR